MTKIKLNKEQEKQLKEALAKFRKIRMKAKQEFNKVVMPAYEEFLETKERVLKK